MFYVLLQGGFPAPTARVKPDIFLLNMVPSITQDQCIAMFATLALSITSRYPPCHLG